MRATTQNMGYNNANGGLLAVLVVALAAVGSAFVPGRLPLSVGIVGGDQRRCRVRWQQH